MAGKMNKSQCVCSTSGSAGPTSICSRRVGLTTTGSLGHKRSPPTVGARGSISVCSVYVICGKVLSLFINGSNNSTYLLDYEE